MASLISRIRQKIRSRHGDHRVDLSRYRFYSRFIGPSDLSFDIGANSGNRTRVFAALGKMVVAVEPQDVCMECLKAEFGENPKVVLVKKALGGREGWSEIMVSNADTISSLSPEWVCAVKRSGRFSEYVWERKELVEVTTLDNLIQTFGVPAFIKIDVEGYESEVLNGLSTPVPALSFEFVPEFLPATFKCIDRLSSISSVMFNYSLGESMSMALDRWAPREEIMAVLSKYADNDEVFGDVYARLQPR